MEREYIAFISYRHTPVDTEAAVAIQHIIEHYKIPKKLQKDGKSRLGMVFRDTDELNISSDLSDALCTALDHSEYLLVLCSPQYKESQWCRHEIVYFLKHHDIDHVLPILVNGDPTESFPEELFRRTIVDGEEVLIEPLAGNIASDTIKGMKQNLNREYLRIISRMLDCNFDELVQRQKRYERRRKFIGFGIAFSVLFAFIGMLLVKNAQVNARYQEARQNQARYLSTVSLEQYNQGDRQAAIDSVLTILPEEKDEGPVAPEQMYALATAVNAYSGGFVPSDLLELKEKTTVMCSDNMKYLYSYTEEALKVYELETSEICYTFRPKQFLKEHPELSEEDWFLNDSIHSLRPADGSRFFVSLGTSILYLDIEDPSFIKQFHDAETNVTKMRYASGKLAASTAKTTIFIYDCDTEEIIYENDFSKGSEESPVSYEILDMCWDENGDSLAIGFNYAYTEEGRTNTLHTDPELNKHEEDFFAENPAMGLVLLDPETNETTTISSARTKQVSFQGDHIAAVHYRYPTTIIKTFSVMLDPTKLWYASLYDCQTGECFYTGDTFSGESENTFGFFQEPLLIDDAQHTVDLLWLGKTAAVIDAETREILYLETFHSDIIKLSSFRGRYVDFFLSNGSIQHMVLGETDNLRSNSMKLDITVEDAWIKNEEYYILSTKGLIHCTNSSWTDYHAVTSSDPILSAQRVTDFQYFDTSSGTLRMVKYENPEDYLYSGISRAFELYSVLSDTCVFSYIPEDEETLILEAFISTDGSLTTILEEASDGSVILSRYSLKNGDRLFRSVLSEDDNFDASGYYKHGMSSDGKSLFWIASSDTLHLYDLSGEMPKGYIREMNDSIELPTLTADSSCLTWIKHDFSEDVYSLVVFDTETREIKEAELPFSDFSAYSSSITPIKSGVLMIYNNANEVLIFNTETMEFLSSFSVHTGSRLAFLSGTNELLICHGTTLSLYDFETQNLKSELELSSAPDKLITDSSSNMIAAAVGNYYDSGNDNGWYLGGCYLIYISEDRQLYTNAFINSLGIEASVSLSNGEIALPCQTATGENYFEYDHFNSFEELREKAEELRKK